MKKIILSIALTAFAAIAAQAADCATKACTTAQQANCPIAKKAECATAQKVSCTTAQKADCATAQQAGCTKVKADQQASASCCSKAKQAVKKTEVKQALLSPKAAAAL